MGKGYWYFLEKGLAKAFKRCLKGYTATWHTVDEGGHSDGLFDAVCRAWGQVLGVYVFYEL